MNTFSIEAALKYGWETFQKRTGFFVGATAIILISSWLISFATAMIFGPGDSSHPNTLGSIFNFLISIFIDMGAVTLLLKAYDSVESAQYSDLWNPSMYLSFLIASFLTMLAFIGGLFLLVIPGLIAMVMFMFTKYLVIDRALSPIDAMKESARITKGNRISLFLFLLALLFINLIGMICLFVGLFVTVPVSGLALVYAYRTLSHHASEVVAAAPVTPTVPTATI